MSPVIKARWLIPRQCSSGSLPITPPDLACDQSYRAILRAALVAGVLSGVPSTVHAVVTRRSVLASTRAAGTLLGRATVARGVLAHVGVTCAWTTVLWLVLPDRRTAMWGAIGGLGIGLLDLGIARRRFPAIAALPRWPQLADHVAFGALVGATLASRPLGGELAQGERGAVWIAHDR